MLFILSYDLLQMQAGLKANPLCSVSMCTK